MFYVIHPILHFMKVNWGHRLDPYGAPFALRPVGRTEDCGIGAQDTVIKDVYR